MKKSAILKGAIITGIINAIINGLINWFQLSDSKTINLTIDSISSEEHTVLAALLF